MKQVPGWVGALAVGCTFLLLVWGELRRPLRRREAEPKLRRDARNLTRGWNCRSDVAVRKFVVTPRMQGIHHSIVKEEQESNWSSGLTLWDYLQEPCGSTFRKLKL